MGCLPFKGRSGQSRLIIPITLRPEVSKFLKNLIPLFMRVGYLTQIYSKPHFNKFSFRRYELKNWRALVYLLCYNPARRVSFRQSAIYKAYSDKQFTDCKLKTNLIITLVFSFAITMQGKRCASTADYRIP
jgi:hypothetical protein